MKPCFIRAEGKPSLVPMHGGKPDGTNCIEDTHYLDVYIVRRPTGVAVAACKLQLTSRIIEMCTVEIVPIYLAASIEPLASIISFVRSPDVVEIM